VAGRGVREAGPADPKGAGQVQGASLERLYLSWNSGGRGLVNLWDTWEREVVSSVLYLYSESCR